jgi:hypothetical protein
VKDPDVPFGIDVRPDKLAPVPSIHVCWQRWPILNVAVRVRQVRLLGVLLFLGARLGSKRGGRHKRSHEWKSHSTCKSHHSTSRGHSSTETNWTFIFNAKNLFILFCGIDTLIHQGAFRVNTPRFSSFSGPSPEDPSEARCLRHISCLNVAGINLLPELKNPELDSIPVPFLGGLPLMLWMRTSLQKEYSSCHLFGGGEG